MLWLELFYIRRVPSENARRCFGILQETNPVGPPCRVASAIPWRVFPVSHQQPLPAKIASKFLRTLRGRNTHCNGTWRRGDAKRCRCPVCNDNREREIA